MRMKGAQDKEIFNALHISKQTFYKWIREHSDFADAYKKGLDDAVAEATKALISKFSAQTLTEKRTEIWQEKGGYQRAHTVTTERQVAPDTAAIIFFLKAKAGWRENTEIVDTTALEKLDAILRQTQQSAEEEDADTLEETA